MNAIRPAARAAFREAYSRVRAVESGRASRGAPHDLPPMLYGAALQAWMERPGFASYGQLYAPDTERAPGFTRADAIRIALRAARLRRALAGRAHAQT